MRLSRLVIIEKHTENDYPVFKWTQKGQMNCAIFVQGIGGWEKLVGHTNPVESSTALYLANKMWQNLKIK